MNETWTTEQSKQVHPKTWDKGEAKKWPQLETETRHELLDKNLIRQTVPNYGEVGNPIFYLSLLSSSSHQCGNDHLFYWVKRKSQRSSFRFSTYCFVKYTYWGTTLLHLSCPVKLLFLAFLRLPMISLESYSVQKLLLPLLFCDTSFVKMLKPISNLNISSFEQRRIKNLQTFQTCQGFSDMVHEGKLQPIKRSFWISCKCLFHCIFQPSNHSESAEHYFERISLISGQLGPLLTIFTYIACCKRTEASLANHK